jgi:hypothetical protein
MPQNWLCGTEFATNGRLFAPHFLPELIDFQGEMFCSAP